MLRILVASLVMTLVLSSPSVHATQAGSDASAQGPWTLEEIITAVEDEPQVLLGVFDGPDCETFGSITDAAIDAAGRVFVLDAQRSVVTGFDSEGECLFQVGRQGQGPGEFIRPRRIAVTDEGMLIVLNSGNGRIERFDLSSADPEPLPSIPLGIRSADFCHLDERLFVAAMQADEAIHEIGEDGIAQASFGSLHESNNPAERVIGSPEVMLCHEPTGSIVLAARHLPAVHRYMSEGERVFAGTFPGFIPAELVVREGRIAGYRPSSEGLHYAVSAIGLASNAVLLQSGLPRDRSRMFGWVNSALFDVDAGVLVLVHDELPHVFAARGQWLVAAHHEEIPRIGIWTRPDQGSR